MDTAPPPPHAGSLAFLLSQVGARSAQLFSERLAPLGISARAFGVLSYLASTGSQSQQQLADALDIHRNAMVGVIDDLEAAGLAQRHRSSSDRRAFEVRLTRTGSALVARANALLPSLEDEVARGLTSSERGALTALLRHAADGLGLRPGVHPHLRAAR